MLIVRLLNSVIFLMEMLIFISTSSAEVNNIKFPPKFSYNDNLRPERKSSSRRSRSDQLSDLSSKNQIGVNSIEQSRILEFINVIRTNPIEQNAHCARAQDKVINLSDFDYKFDHSAFHSFSKQAKEAKFIASFLNDLYFKYQTFDPRSLNDEYTPAILSLLRSVLTDDPVLAGGGIAFSNNFFPYIYRNNGDLSKEMDLSKKYAFKNAEFYTTHSQKKINQSRFSSTSGSRVPPSMQEEDAFWGAPYFDCMHLKRWITFITFPLYAPQGSSVIFK